MALNKFPLKFTRLEVIQTYADTFAKLAESVQYLESEGDKKGDHPLIKQAAEFGELMLTEIRGPRPEPTTGETPQGENVIPLSERKK